MYIHTIQSLSDLEKEHSKQSDNLVTDILETSGSFSFRVYYSDTNRNTEFFYQVLK